MTGLLLAVTDDGSGNPGPVPLLIVLLLLVATVLLIRNMSGRIKRLPPSFPDEQQEPDGDEDRPPPG